MRYSLLLCLFIAEVSYSQQIQFPLHVGDQWEYGAGYYTKTITGDTILPNGKQYATVYDSYYSQTFFIRQDINKVYYLQDFIDTAEVLQYEFGHIHRDTIFKIPDTLSAGNFKIVVIYVDSMQQSVFGKTRTTYHFRSVYDNYVYDDSWIADSIGIVYIEWSCLCGAPPIFWEISGALVNGQQYGTITGLRSDWNNIPPSFSLSQNFPNPFNPSTTIRYELPEQSLVSLKVFNILGQHIATLVNETQNAGTKLINFNANSLSNGVYYYTLSAMNGRSSFTQTQKMLLVK